MRIRNWVRWVLPMCRAKRTILPLFHSVIGNVANLQPRVVEAIVRFYTYLKMSRDAAGSLASWEQQTNLDVRRHHVSYVVYLLALSMIWGHVALWHMGQAARKADREFWLQIHAVAIA